MHKFRWLADVANSFRTSRCPEGNKVRLASCLLKERARDWWEEVGRAMVDDFIDGMTWDNFLPGFELSFSLLLRCNSWHESSRISARLL